jgi:CRP-like cAMP-binding protein
MTIDDTLRRSEIFLGLDDNELKMISMLPSSKQESYPSGQVIFKAGDEAQKIYILEDGKVNIIMEAQISIKDIPAEVVVDIITRGGVFGWSALVKPHLYVLSAVCQSPCKVTIIDGSELRNLFENNVSIGYKVLQGLSQVINSRFRGLEQVLLLGKRWPFIEKQSGN